MKHRVYWTLVAITICACLPGYLPAGFAAEVTCGTPTHDNTLTDVKSSKVEVDENLRSVGYIDAQTINRPHPEGGWTWELWMLSVAVGDWWQLITIRVHPEDLPKLAREADRDGDYRGIRRIVDSPFLEEPVVAANETNLDSVVALIAALKAAAFYLECKS